MKALPYRCSRFLCLPPGAAASLRRCFGAFIRAPGRRERQAPAGAGIPGRRAGNTPLPCPRASRARGRSLAAAGSRGGPGGRGDAGTPRHPLGKGGTTGRGGEGARRGRRSEIGEPGAGGSESGLCAPAKGRWWSVRGLRSLVFFRGSPLFSVPPRSLPATSANAFLVSFQMPIAILMVTVESRTHLACGR